MAIIAPGDVLTQIGNAESPMRRLCGCATRLLISGISCPYGHPIEREQLEMLLFKIISLMHSLLQSVTKQYTRVDTFLRSLRRDMT